MGGVIDLNTDNDDDDDDVVALVEGASPTLSLSSPSLTSSSSASACFSTSTATLPVCLELWHANAGPLISLLRKGNVVVYLLQGHLEQMPDFPAVVYELPPHVFCRVVDVKLHAEVPSNEVFAQISLVPESESNYLAGRFELPDSSVLSLCKGTC